MAEVLLTCPLGLPFIHAARIPLDLVDLTEPDQGETFDWSGCGAGGCSEGMCGV